MGLFEAAHRYGDKKVPLLLLHISYNDETWQLYLPLPCFCCSSCWPYTHICLQSYLVNLEQVTNHYDCLEEVSVPFLPTDTNWKGRKLDKSQQSYSRGRLQFHTQSRLFGLHVLIAFFRKEIFDKSAVAISCKQNFFVYVEFFVHNFLRDLKYLKLLFRKCVTYVAGCSLAKTCSLTGC